jgi:hypothetical protein
MKNILAIAGLCALLAAPAFAQTNQAAEEADTPPTAEEIEDAASTISAMAANQAQAEGYCAIQNEIDAAPEGDEAAADALGEKMDAYLAGLGEDIAEAFDIADSVDEASPDNAKIDAAFAELDQACGS